MTAFATLPRAERGLLIEEAAGRLAIAAVIVEKDFWVCWMLRQLFHEEALSRDLVFKGGTSLSKVFRVIARFSEDVDLSITPEALGHSEARLNDAPSATRRRKEMVALEAACARHVADVLRPVLETAVRTRLGARGDRRDWLSYELDDASRSPVVRFEYPSVLTQPGGYVPKLVKLEFGSLTNQRPVGTHPVTPLLAQVLPGAYDDCEASVVALDVERTFWEKATILHAEFHRPQDQPIRDRSARHYSDFAALWNHASRPGAVARVDLLDDVARHKSRFFAARWASYETAARGSLRLVPPDHRVADLRRDFAKMRPMFLTEPPTFDDVLAVLTAAERELNGA